MRTFLLAAGAALLLATPVASGGGFATAGLAPPPDDIRAGDTWNAQITILQHGRTPLEGVEPSVLLLDEDGGVAATFPAEPAGEPGVYVAKVEFPRAGTWRYQVNDGFSQTHSYAPVEIAGPGSGGGFSVPAWTWGLGFALVALAALLLLARRARPAQAPVAQP